MVIVHFIHLNVMCINYIKFNALSTNVKTKMFTKFLLCISRKFKSKFYVFLKQLNFSFLNTVNIREQKHR